MILRKVAHFADCPDCRCDLRGEPIPEEFIVPGYSGPPESAPTHYSRALGVIVRGTYDGVLFWICPECGYAWHRWPGGSFQHRAAEPLIASRNNFLEARKAALSAR